MPWVELKPCLIASVPVIVVVAIAPLIPIIHAFIILSNSLICKKLLN